jgi:dienelactone hydrolase
LLRSGSLAPALLIALALLVPAGAADAALTLPAPTGPERVGTAIVRLVDTSRSEPFAAGKRREVVVQLWYPTRARGGSPAPYLTVAEARVLARGLGVSASALAHTRTHAAFEAPAKPGRRPLVLVSPGLGLGRAFASVIAVDLASAGYLVAALDHPYDGAAVELRDGTVARSRVQPPGGIPRAVAVRVADMRFVLDRIAVLAARFGAGVDLRHVAVVGHSLGGTAAARLMAADARVDAGVDLDGSLLAPVRGALARPFLVFSAEGGTLADPTIVRFRRALRGPHPWLLLHDAGHLAFSDIVALAPQLDPAARGQFDLGRIDARRAVVVQRGVLRAFLDRYLRGRAVALPSYPELSFNGP